MSDQDSEHDSAPPKPQASDGAFDWLVESHRQSAPLTPLPDEAPAWVPPISFGFPEPQEPPAPPLPDVRPTTLSQAPPPPAPSSFPLRFTETPDEAEAWQSEAAFPPQSAFPPPQSAVPPQQPVFAAPRIASVPQPEFPPPRSAFSAPQPAVIVQPEFPPPQSAFSVPQPAVIVQSAVFVQPEPVATAPPQPTVGQAGPAMSFSASPDGGGGFGLQRRQPQPRSANGPLDWVAFVLAFLAPPVGLLLGIGAVVTEPRTKGFVTGLAKAAIGIGAVLSLVLGVGLAVYAKVSNDQAAYNAIVASSRAWCSTLKSDPATLTSDTFDWPAPADTIPESITAMKSYQARWDTLVKFAPAGIRTDTQKIATTAKSIVAGVESTQTLDDGSDVAQMQNAVATTGINAWASRYCK